MATSARDAALQRAADARKGGSMGPPSTGSAWGSMTQEKRERRVFVGKRQTNVTPNFLRGGPIFSPQTTERTVRANVRDVKTESEALAEFYGWVGTPKMKQWGQHLVNAGLIDDDEADDYGTLLKYWETAVDQSAAATETGRDIDPWKMAQFMGSATGGAGRKKKGSGQEAFSGARTTTDRSVDITDPETAKGMVNDILTRQLGRRANPEELAAFTSALNNAERANPVVTTTTTNYQEGTPMAQSSTSTGGLDAAGAQNLLEEQAMQKPEWGAYQASTTYFNALQQAIQATAQT